MLMPVKQRVAGSSPVHGSKNFHSVGKSYFDCQINRVVQWVEHHIFNVEVVGSNPTLI